MWSTLLLVLRTCLGIAGVALLFKFVQFVRFKRSLDASIPGPGFLTVWKMLYDAGLGEFYGLNPRFYEALHARYGTLVKFWLGPLGPAWISFSDVDDITAVNKAAKGRPAMTKLLLPFLGDKNLLFQKTKHDNGAFVKQLRLRYGDMVNGAVASQRVHRIAIQRVGVLSAGWGASATPVDVFEELKLVLYDVMGDALFGAPWSSGNTGREVFALHRYCLDLSAQMGLSVLKTPTLGNCLRSGSDVRKYNRTIAEWHGICARLIQERRDEVAADPEKWKEDPTALTMLATDKKESADGSEKTDELFFDEALGIATCCGFLNAAYDTTHMTTFWALYHLAKHQDIQRRVIQEIDERVAAEAKSEDEGEAEAAAAGTRELTRAVRTLEAVRAFSGNHKLPLLWAVTQESIRLKPTVPINFRCNEISSFAVPSGKTIPQGVDLYIYYAGMFRSKATFGADADTFNPERFIGSSEAAKKARRSFLGFGSHNRMCVGFKFAEAEVQAILATLLRQYTVHLADPSFVAETKYEAGCTAPKHTPLFVFRPRSA